MLIYCQMNETRLDYTRGDFSSNSGARNAGLLYLQKLHTV